MVILPLNFALTGPTFATSTTSYWLSPARSMLSHPGMQSFRIWGSLSAFQVSCWGSGINCSPVISIVSPSSERGQGALHDKSSETQKFPLTAGRLPLSPWLFCSAEHAREIRQALDVVRRQKFIHVGQHGLDAGRSRLECLVAQEGIQPDQAATRLAQPFHLCRKVCSCIAVEAVTNEEHHGAMGEQSSRPPHVEFLQ